ncbi:MAG TPA: ABC transporter permease [Anaerolineales bacterium]|nr:ABC transporter permease [Anaerolineales bacterium]
MTQGYQSIFHLLSKIPSNLWTHRELTGHLSSREISQRYRNSYLGILWSLITPMTLLAIYTFVFSTVFQSRWRSDQPATTGEFALILFAGLAAFNVFSEVSNRAPMIILNNPNYVKRVVFPLEIWPVVLLNSALVNSLIACGLIVSGQVLLNWKVSATLLLLPLAYVPLVLLTLGVGWFLASLGVYVRDIGQGIGLAIQILFFLSPVFYPISAVPSQVADILQANPLTFILTMFRQILLWGEIPDWRIWIMWSVLGLLFAVSGYLWFMKTKKGFADVL